MSGDDDTSTFTFRERFSFAGFSDGGVVVDTHTGEYTHLNLTAAAICAALIDSLTLDEAIGASAALLKLPILTARRYVLEVIRSLMASAGRSAPTTRLRYELGDDGGFDFSLSGRPILHVTANGHQLSLVADPNDVRPPVHELVRQLVSRLAFFQGMTVIHGSVVEDGQGALLLSGVSGAGKSTLAQALLAAGRSITSDDLIVLAPVGDTLLVSRTGEQALHAWAAATADWLCEHPGEPADTTAVRRASEGPYVPAKSIWFLDASRRLDTDAIALRALGPSETLLRVLQNSFVGAAEWRRHLETLAQLVTSLAGYEPTLPNSVERLRRAADQSVNSAS